MAVGTATLVRRALAELDDLDAATVPSNSSCQRAAALPFGWPPFDDLDKTIDTKSTTFAFSKPFFRQGLINRCAVLKSSYAQFAYLLAGADDDQIDRMRAHITALHADWRSTRSA